MTHKRAEELLAAFADDGLDGRERQDMAEHVAGCARCTAEVKAIRALLADVRRAPAGEQRDEAFFREFSRDVRLAYDKAAEAEKAGLWAWLRRPALIAAVCAAATAAFGVALVARRAGAPDRPAVLHPVPPVIEDQEDLSPPELARVLHSFEGEAPAPGVADEDMAVVSPGGAEIALETLDDDALTRLDTEL
ncbi:MAG TPA: zf-HC2 domain-containing protein [Haliangiales bacterium]|nr:zf-HC2 domain-containing protein [Haliangiales bacterium]